MSDAILTLAHLWVRPGADFGQISKSGRFWGD